MSDCGTMSNVQGTPPPKGRRRHNHTKSATTTTVDGGSSPAPKNGQRRQRQNRQRQDNNNNVKEHEASQVTDNAAATDSALDTQAPEGHRSERSRKPRNKNRHDNSAHPPLSDQSPLRYDSPSAHQQHNVPYVFDRTPILATPAKPQTAYAGPTFHASPAPSSLPVPKFFSKSVPANAGNSSLQARLEGESDGNSSTDEIPAMPEVSQREESPLDFFFRADRAEKARKGNALQNALAAPDLGNRGKEVPVNNTHHTRQASAQHGKEMFPMELEGSTSAYSNGSVDRPEIDRIRTSRSMNSDVNSGHINESLNQSLKEYLFSQQPTPPQSRREPESHFHTPSPFNRPNIQRSASGPSTPAPSEIASQSTLHYGNKNLSPLFRAIKNEPPRPSSGLRQELPASPVDVSKDTVYTQNHFKTHGGGQSYVDGPLPPHHNVFSQPNQASGSTPNLPSHFAQHNQPGFNSGQVPSNNRPFYTNNPRNRPFTQQEPPATAPGAVNGMSSGVTAGPDVQSMENDLRRLLNLNAMGTGGSATTGVR